MGFDLKFQDVGLILQSLMFFLVCFLGIILLWVHKQEGEIPDIYLESDAYLSQAFLPWKGKYFL